MYKVKPRLFKVIRHRDLKNNSGVGKVIDGVVFADGQVVIQWQHDTASISIFKNLADFQRIHVKPIFNENEFIWYDGYKPSDEVIEAMQQMIDYILSYSGGRINDKSRGELAQKAYAIQRSHIKQQNGGLNPSTLNNIKRNQRPPVRNKYE